MIWRVLCSIFLNALLVAAVSAAVDAPISTVVLHPGSATVERTVSVPVGSNLLEITDIPANFDTKTLFVRADEGVRVGQVTIMDSGIQKGIHPREKELEKKVRELQDRIDSLDIEVKSATLVTGFLERFNGGDKSSFDSKAVAGIVETIGTAASNALLWAQQAEISKRQIKEEMDRVQFELKQVQSGNKQLRGVSIRTSAEKAGRMFISYQVNRAGWQPTYRALLDSRNSNIELERLAAISQKTGEDWKDVKLKLSTERPQAHRDPVDPMTRQLTYIKPRSEGVQPQAMPFQSAPLQGGMPPAPAAGKPNEDNYVAPVIETEGLFATEFEVPGSVTLPADGREISVSLGKQSVAVEQTVQVAPSLNTDAILTTDFERPPGVWLPGTIQLYRDGHYIGATRWKPDAGERFTLGFGRDDLLRVAVSRKNQQSGSSGLVGRLAQQKVSDLYTLTNLHKSAIEIVVLEPAPVSQSEEIDIELSFSPTPSDENWKSRTGVVAWKKKLAPGETLKINVGYAISHPKEGRVSGLRYRNH